MNTQPLTDALQTKCSACGGFMHYSPDEENLKCVYCGSIVDLDKTAARITENDFLYWKDRANESAGDDMVEMPEIKCRQCGATTSLPANVSGAKCAFCSTPLIMNEATVKRFWQPNYLLPFKVSSRTGGKNFAQWIGGKWFAPSALKKNAVSFDTFKGVYLPFWTYDSNTFTEYKGQRGIDRRVRYKDAKGDTRERIVTDWYPAAGQVKVAFDDVLVPASKTLPQSIAGRLTNWDLANCVAYRKEFLAGFVTEIYQRDFRESLDDAKTLMQPVIEHTIYRDIGGDRQRISSSQTRYDNLMFKHLLLPVWISAFRYNNQLYQFVVNGRTGQITGNYPKSTGKIVAVVFGVIAVIVALWWMTN